MKKKVLLSILVIVSLFAITGCGSDKKTNDHNSSASSKSITYKEYSINDFSFELPSDWKVVEESNGGIKVTNLGDSAFSILVTSKVPTAQFEYFGETFMVDNLKNMDYTLVGSYKKNTYGSYKAYDYEAETMIQGKKAPVKITTLNVDESAITLLLVYVDNNYDYETIYSHILGSIK